ncbi:hypothetical protein GCM10009799_31210 [Nocardiopsis rhodophaea]|uniref:DUF3885 domain-containing protein n=1 Tax=Nocardiopsis rhodophaea TaxID=280238 RepID=A0ABN2T9F2_9ACTN
MKSGSIDDLLGWLATRGVVDVVVPGYVDRTLHEDKPFFNAQNSSLYLDTDEGLLCIADRKTHGQLHLSVTDSLTDARTEIEAVLNHDDGEEFLPLSLEWQFLADGRDFNTLTRARYVLGPYSRPDEAVIDSLELVFDDCCCLFIEPTWDGLVTGSHGSYEHWTKYVQGPAMDQRREVEWRLSGSVSGS